MQITDINQLLPSTAGITQLPESETNSLGKEDFLNLLVTQLKNQDPLAPVDNKDLILQLSQFSTLEGTQNLNDNMSKYINTANLATAGSLIGTDVVYTDTGTGLQMMGNVSSVKVVGTNANLVIDGVQVPLNQVTSISLPNLSE